MRFSTAAVTAAALATGVFAQFPPAVQQVIQSLSPQCQQTVFGLLTSPAVECLNIPQTISIVTDFANNNPNGTLAVPIDQLLALDCASAGCSNATLSSLAQNITSGCANELQQYDISAANVTFAFAQYPLAREIACLRTSNYESENATTTLESPPYNITNGTAFCATSLLNTVADKVDANLTIPFFMDLYRSYQNGSISEYGKLFKPEDLCDECIFAAADVLGVAYPAVGNLTLTSLGLGGKVNSSVANVTVSQALDSTCAAEGLQWNSNGTLPANITLGAQNSTFGFRLVTENSTFEPEMGSPIAKRRNVADIKARWVGQY